MHCANDALQLGRLPHQRFRDATPPGAVHCLICRETRVDCRVQTPESAYLTNHALMAVMDVLGLGGHCRACDEDCGSQAALLQHYTKRCPHAVVRCRYRGCSVWHRRAAAPAHEETCPIGRAACSQCGTWVDREDMLRHMVTTCRMRVVNCVLCKHSCRLPDMLRHLREHQHQLAATSPPGGRASNASATAVAAAQAVAAGALGVAGAAPAWQGLPKPEAAGPVGHGAGPGAARLLSGGAGAAVAAAAAAAAATGQGMPRARSVEDAVAEAAAALAAIQHQQLSREVSAVSPIAGMAAGPAGRGMDMARDGTGTDQASRVGGAAGAASTFDRGSGSSTDSAESERGARLAAAAAVAAPPPPAAQQLVRTSQQPGQPQEGSEGSSPSQDMQRALQQLQPQQFTTQEVQQQAQRLLEQLLRRQQRRLQERAQQQAQQQPQPPAAGGNSMPLQQPRVDGGALHQVQQHTSSGQPGSHGPIMTTTALVPSQQQTQSLLYQQYLHLQQQLHTQMQQLQQQQQQQRHAQAHAALVTSGGLPGSMAASLALHLVRNGAGNGSNSTGYSTAAPAATAAAATAHASTGLLPPRSASAGGLHAANGSPQVWPHLHGAPGVASPGAAAAQTAGAVGPAAWLPPAATQRATVMGISSAPDMYPLQQQQQRQPSASQPVALASPLPAQAAQPYPQPTAASSHTAGGGSPAAHGPSAQAAATAAGAELATAPVPRASMDLPSIPGHLQRGSASSPGADADVLPSPGVAVRAALARPPVAADARSAGSYRNLQAALTAAAAASGTPVRAPGVATPTGVSAAAHSTQAASGSSSRELELSDRLRRRAAFWDSDVEASAPDSPQRLAEAQASRSQMLQAAAAPAGSTSASVAAAADSPDNAWAGGDALRGLMGVEGEDAMANAVAAAAAFAAAMGPGSSQGGGMGGRGVLLGGGSRRSSLGGLRGGTGPPWSAMVSHGHGRDGAGGGIGMAGALSSNLYAAAAAQAAQAVQAMQAALAAQAQAEEEADAEDVRLLRTAAAIVRVSAANAEERRSARQQGLIGSPARPSSSVHPRTSVPPQMRHSEPNAQSEAAAAALARVTDPAAATAEGGALAPLPMLPAVSTGTGSADAAAAGAAARESVSSLRRTALMAAGGGMPAAVQPPTPIRRSFSDTELVWEPYVLEELVRTASIAGEWSAGRVSASGL
ncbi:hypothetical protein HYH02_009058 [Chlamydomonas schloesseri]|uniref:TRAF-type domain-containing protein n=1 Tax=Chlamydomonas schloesseri TaxID=2026947 RepID=A0A835WB77_9CHLO|nr:hypothetical protein HYH02_009058 [Chlamydomonas schloesseri]|eukprot:KAG2444117.1 hypothetical protein HYH02_009058 [Chlamydomonas schloesseri]